MWVMRLMCAVCFVGVMDLCFMHCEVEIVWKSVWGFLSDWRLWCVVWIYVVLECVDLCCPRICFYIVYAVRIVCFMVGLWCRGLSLCAVWLCVFSGICVFMILVACGTAKREEPGVNPGHMAKHMAPPTSKGQLQGQVPEKLI